MLVGAGANITVYAGDEGLLMVDTGLPAMSEKVFAAIRSISNGPLRYIVNTSERGPHAGANAMIAPKGETIPFRLLEGGSGGGGRVGGRLPTDRASVIAHLSVFDRMSAPAGKESPFPEAAWPDNTYSTPLKKLNFNREPVVIMHFPGPTDGNSVVQFRTADVLSVGDLVDLNAFPPIDVAAGGDVNQLIDSLNRLLDLTVAGKKSEGGTMVVPGHGHVADVADVAYYRDMVTIIRDRVKDMASKGMTLQQILAAGPTREYNPRYGKTTGDWTTDKFVEAVYRGVSK
jgi:glyoxylase-like metal-dependent hydrolase (beta-lactamase superfamily II)